MKPDGFPLEKWERNLLDALLNGPQSEPKGGGHLTVRNLHRRKWIEKLDDGRYAITAEGRLARQVDDAALALGFRRRSSKKPAPALAAFENLLGTLERLRLCRMVRTSTKGVK